MVPELMMAQVLCYVCTLTMNVSIKAWHCTPCITDNSKASVHSHRDVPAHGTRSAIYASDTQMPQPTLIVVVLVNSTVLASGAPWSHPGQTPGALSLAGFATG